MQLCLCVSALLKDLLEDPDSFSAYLTEDLGLSDEVAEAFINSNVAVTKVRTGTSCLH